MNRELILTLSAMVAILLAGSGCAAQIKPPPKQDSLGGIKANLNRAQYAMEKAYANVIVDLASVHKMSVSGGSGSIRAGQSSEVGGQSTLNLVPASTAETLSKGQLKKAVRLFSQRLIESK